MTAIIHEEEERRLKQIIEAQQKTIAVLMDAAERSSREGMTSLRLLSHNLSLEKVVQNKTEKLQRQGQELQRALLDLQQTQAQLLHASKLEAVGQMAAGIAHEINTPIQFIGANIDFLADAFKDIQTLIRDVEQFLTKGENEVDTKATCRNLKEKLEEIDWEYLREEIPASIKQSQDGIKRVSIIVQAMKEFSHPGSREKQLYDINRILMTTITVSSNEWKYVANIETELDPELPKVFCLADDLGQVFLNIIVNGAHAIDEKQKKGAGGDKGTIRITTTRDENFAIIKIADSGIGIAPEIQKRIFDPFFTTKQVGKGTGQGLAIAHDIICHKHQGAIICNSVPGKGAEFILSLPLAIVEF